MDISSVFEMLEDLFSKSNLSAGAELFPIVFWD